MCLHVTLDIRLCNSMLICFIIVRALYCVLVMNCCCSWTHQWIWYDCALREQGWCRSVLKWIVREFHHDSILSTCFSLLKKTWKITVVGYARRFSIVLTCCLSVCSDCSPVYSADLVLRFRLSGPRPPLWSLDQVSDVQHHENWVSRGLETITQVSRTSSLVFCRLTQYTLCM